MILVARWCTRIVHVTHFERTDKMNLYNLTAEYQHALDSIQIDEETGEVTGFEAVDALDVAFEDKAEAYAVYIKSLDAMAGALQAEAKSLADRKKAVETRRDQMKNHLALSMVAVGKEKIETPRAALSFRKSTSTQITDETKLRDDLWVVKTERKPDKTAIGKLLKAGEIVLGAELKQSKNLQVK